MAYNVNDDTKKSNVFSNDADRRPLGEVFSGVKHYCNFVKKFGFYPNRDDFLLYSFNAVRNCEYSHYTLPSEFFAANIISWYSKIIKDTTPADFIKIYESSMNRDKRIALEQELASDHTN